MPTKEELIEAQKKERTECLEKILASKSPKKIIVAGAGTGKTYTFKEILKANPADNNVAMTFIRLLSNEMYNYIGDLAEVKTFHAFCKRILHEQNGRVDLYSFLPQIIEEDAKFLSLNLSAFEQKFQLIQEDSAEVKFYI